MKIWSWAIAILFICTLGLFIGPGIAESRIIDVSAAPGGCGIALNDNGTIWLWGSVAYNDDLGLQPVIMPGMDHVVSVTGALCPVVLKDDGTVWLIRNYPMFEDPARMATCPDKEPVKVDGLNDIIAIDGSQTGGYGDNLIALKKDGTVWTMGSNSHGQRGTGDGFGDDNWHSTDVNQVAGLTDVKAVSMGAAHALAVKNDGTVWSWGFNNNGQLGDGTVAHDPMNDGGQTNPVMVKGLNNVTAVAAGMEFSMALKDDGTVWTWGRNTFGQLGDGVPGNVEEYRATPVQVKGLTNIIAISAGQWFALALRDDGTVWAWGDNRDFGMLGDGTLENNNVPVQVNGLSGIVAISAGCSNSYALDKFGVVWGWGDNSAGQLGDGNHGAYVKRPTADKVPFTEALAGPGMDPGWMGSSRPPIRVTIPVQELAIDYMATMDSSIYAFGNNTLIVMDDRGMKKWDLSIPGAWTYRNAYGIIVNSRVKGTYESYDAATATLTKTDAYSMIWQSVKTVPTFAAVNGHTYLYVLANASDSGYDPLEGLSSLDHPVKAVEKELLAIAPDGMVEWSHHFVDDVAVQDLSHMEVHNGRIYLYHGYNESVFDASGNLLFTIENVADPVSVDESGSTYALPAVKTVLPSMPTAHDGGYYDYRVPARSIIKYGPEGTPVWQKDIPGNITRPYFMPAVRNDEIGLPLYRNGVLYVPAENGIIAMDQDGTPLWTKTYDDTYNLFYLMPMDPQGNVYIFNQHAYERYHDSNMTIIAIRPDGSELGRVDVAPPFITCAFEGILYKDGRSTEQLMARSGLSSGHLDPIKLTAYDLTRGKNIWAFTTPIGDTRTVTVNESNVLALFPDYFKSGDPAGSLGDDHSRAQIIPAGDLTYIYFKTATWDDPIVYDQSTYTYYSALYALDKDGKLVWQRPMDNFLTAATANNTTIYYGTSGGGISVSTIEVVAGLAVAASLLLFFKFFVLGGVARARSRIDKNDNRNRIYRFIAERPGSTLYEMSKEMGLNIGTLRYHLMILGINHRIVTYNDDGKFVRYFTNSNTYGKADQLVISLVRRDSMGKILKLILERGEMTNGELCDRTGLPESAVSKYLGELSKKGIVVKEPGARGSFSVKEEQAERVSNAIALMDNRIVVLAGNGPAGEAETC